MRTPFLALILIGFSVSTFAQDKPTLVLGSDAPSFRPQQWLQGEPLEAFQPGQITVIEFWATWCGPCIQSIPHLNQLQKKYDGRVRIIGVNASEVLDDQNTAPVQEVLKIVQDFMSDPAKPKIEYSVAFEHRGSLWKEWFLAAGLLGIPSAFIVDGNGKIAFIGHPMSMDKPLQKIVDGTWQDSAEMKDLAQALEKESIQKARYAALSARFNEANAQGFWMEAARVALEGRELGEPYAPEFTYKAIELMYTRLDQEREANQLRDAWIQENWNDPFYSVELIKLFLKPQFPRIYRDARLENKVVERIVELTDPQYGWYVLSHVAEFYFASGQALRAVFHMQRALQSATGNYAGHAPAIEARLKEMMEPHSKQGGTADDCSDALTN